MIKYSIFETRLGSESKFLGRVVFAGTINRERLVDAMLDLGSTLTKPDIVAVLEVFNKAVEKLCCLGFRINLDGLPQITPSLGGVFAEKGDSFIAPRNSIYLTAQISRGMNKRVAQLVTVEKVSVDTNRPILFKPVDSFAEPGEAGLSVGNIVSVKGKHLKFDPAQAGEYFKLVNTDDQAQSVTISKFHKVSDTELIFIFPMTTFTDAFFELASSMGTSQIRVGRSESFPVVVS